MVLGRPAPFDGTLVDPNQNMLGEGEICALLWSRR